ncbi:hypothetical protein Bca4012_028366 [Brassica carinata]
MSILNYEKKILTLLNLQKHTGSIYSIKNQKVHHTAKGHMPQCRILQRIVFSHLSHSVLELKDQSRRNKSASLSCELRTVSLLCITSHNHLHRFISILRLSSCSDHHHRIDSFSVAIVFRPGMKLLLFKSPLCRVQLSLTVSSSWNPSMMQFSLHQSVFSFQSGHSILLLHPCLFLCFFARLHRSSKSASSDRNPWPQKSPPWCLEKLAPTSPSRIEVQQWSKLAYFISGPLSVDIFVSELKLMKLQFLTSNLGPPAYSVPLFPINRSNT